MFMPQMQRQRMDLWFAPQIIRKYQIICGANDTGKIYVYASNEKTTKGFMVCLSENIYDTENFYVYASNAKTKKGFMVCAANYQKISDNLRRK